MQPQSISQPNATLSPTPVLPQNPTEALARLHNSVTLSDGQSFQLYNAGIKFAGGPDYSRVFARDGLTSAFLLGDLDFLRDLLVFCADTMGRKIDPRNGEEPGKVMHEWPGVELRGYNTQYVAADTTALWLIGLHEYWLGTEDQAFMAKMSESIAKALNYIKTHLRDNLFWDDPKFYRSNGTAVLSGCWRDGGFAERDGGCQSYPASYFMVNLLIVKALRGLQDLQSQLTIKISDNLLEMAEAIKAATLQKFYLPGHDFFSPMIDQVGMVETLYLDSIWSLYFLEPGDLTKDQITRQFDLLSRLQTPYGYLSREHVPGASNVDNCLIVGNAIWPLEQAYLALLAIRFDQSNIMAECTKAASWLNANSSHYREFIALDLATNMPKAAGCDVQLWTVAYQQFLNNLAERL